MSVMWSGNGLSVSASQLLSLPSRPGEFHPEPLTDPDRILSHHPARAIARRLPPSTEQRVPPGEPVGPHQRRLGRRGRTESAPQEPSFIDGLSPPCGCLLPISGAKQKRGRQLLTFLNLNPIFALLNGRPAPAYRSSKYLLTVCARQDFPNE
jgi:hypothetical protein